MEDSKYGELTLRMPSALQLTLGLVAISVAHQLYGLPRSVRVTLTDEVHRRKCTLFLTEAGEVQRAIAVVAVHLQDPDGQVLVHVA